MKKKLLLLLFLISFFNFANAQSWVAVGGGLSVGGYVRTLFVHDSIMYAGGRFTSPGNSIAQWDGSNWSNLGIGINNAVYSMGLYNDTLYVGGYFSRAGGHSVNCIAKWDGTSLTNPGFDVQGGNGVYAIQQYDSLLYIAGTFDSLSHKVNPGLFSWNGIKTDSVYRSYWWSDVTCLDTFNNHLVFGFYNVNSIDAWNNITPSRLGPWNEYFNRYTLQAIEENAFCHYKGMLYMAGYFKGYNNQIMRSIAMWDGSNWNPLDSGIRGHVYALTVYNNMLIAGGHFDTAGGIIAKNIAAWNGTTWQNIGGLDSDVYALTVFKGNLYAGGNFSTGNGIAEYTFPSSQPPPNTATIYPNPNNGVFNIQLSSLNIELTVQIYNALGQKVYSQTTSVNTLQVDLSGTTPGVYIYSISQPGGRPINTGKFVIEKD